MAPNEVWFDCDVCGGSGTIVYEHEHRDGCYECDGTGGWWVLIDEDDDEDEGTRL